MLAPQACRVNSMLVRVPRARVISCNPPARRIRTGKCGFCTGLSRASRGSCFPCRADHTALQAFVVRSVSELSSTCVVDSTVLSRIQITCHPILLHSNASIQQNLQSSIFDTLLKSCLAKSQCKGRPVCDTERASMECRSRRTTSLVSTFSFGSIAESRARHQTH